MTLDIFNQHLFGITSFTCAAALSFIVLTKRVKEGVVIKAGLILMIGALLASGCLSYDRYSSLRGVWNASLLLRAGMLLVVAGYLWRIHSEPRKQSK